MDLKGGWGAGEGKSQCPCAPIFLCFHCWGVCTGALPDPSCHGSGQFHALTWFSKESSHKSPLKLCGHTHWAWIWTQNRLFIVNFAKTHLSNKIYICEPLVLYITICYHSNKLNIHYLQQRYVTRNYKALPLYIKNKLCQIHFFKIYFHSLSLHSLI